MNKYIARLKKRDAREPRVPFNAPAVAVRQRSAAGRGAPVDGRPATVTITNIATAVSLRSVRNFR